MNRLTSTVFVLSLSVLAARADLTLEQKASQGDHTIFTTLKLHGDKMRADEPERGLGVVVDLKSRDSITLMNISKKYMKRSGEDVRKEMEQKSRTSGGTNNVDLPPLPPMDTGKSEVVDGTPAEIYIWVGPNGATNTLWVAKSFPNFDAIQAELAKLDKFNESGPHRGAQPQLSLLPGVVIKNETIIKKHKVTTTLTSVSLAPVDPSIFEVPADYVVYVPEKKP